jgi:anti-sigma B factor antagonist
MEMTHTEQSGIQILTLNGKIMGEPEVTLISEKIGELLDQKKVAIIFDLSQIAWMNSIGLGVCLGTLTRARSRGGDLRFVGLPKVVETLMEKCDILPLFQRFENLDQAINSF